MQAANSHLKFFWC